MPSDVANDILPLASWKEEEKSKFLIPTHTKLHPTSFLLMMILDAKALSRFVRIDGREQILIKQEPPRNIKNKREYEK